MPYIFSSSLFLQLQEEVIIFLDELFLSSISLFNDTTHNWGFSALQQFLLSCLAHITHQFSLNVMRRDPSPSLWFVFTVQRVWSSPCSQMWRTEQWSGVMGGPRSLRAVIDLLSALLSCGLRLCRYLLTHSLSLGLQMQFLPLISAKPNTSHTIVIRGLTKGLLMSSPHISWHTLLTFVLNEGFASQM